MTDQITEVGSSPHARGAPAACLSTVIVLGIIPACAGSTLSACGVTCPNQDHPRMRGEHRSRRCKWRSRGGSSPHARGAQGYNGMPIHKSGIIPACAGSTLTCGCLFG